MERVPVHMPKFGMTMTQAVIVEWFVDVGDAVSEGDPLLTVETEKVNSDVEAPASGTLAEIAHQEGEEIEVGKIIGYIEVE